MIKIELIRFGNIKISQKLQKIDELFKRVIAQEKQFDKSLRGANKAAQNDYKQRKDSAVHKVAQVDPYDKHCKPAWSLKQGA